MTPEQKKAREYLGDAYFRMGHLMSAILGRVLTPRERDLTLDFIRDGRGDAEHLARWMKGMMN